MPEASAKRNRPLAGWEKAAACLLLALAAAAMAKTLFFGLEIDEEYALSISYRLVKGDRLFYTMWEPHQLSALPAAGLIALFMAATGGTTGVLLFIRVVMLAAKALLSIVFYRELRGPLGRRSAFLAAVVLFLYAPKWFLGPDYISQQFHFTLAAFLCFWGYYAHGYRRPWLVAAGSALLCLSFLAFPQSIFAAPVYFGGMAALGAKGVGGAPEPRLLRVPRGALLLAVSCAVCGGAFVLYVLRGMGLGMLLSRAGLILNDPQYNFTAGERLALLGAQAVDVAKSLAKPLAAALLCCGVWAWRQKPGWRRAVSAFWVLWAGFAVLLCMVRAVRGSAIDERQFLPVLALAGAWFFWEGSPRKNDARRLLFWLGYLPGIAAYLFILRSTLLGFAPTFMYLTWPVVCGVLALGCGDAAQEAEPDGAGWCGGLLLLLAAFLLVCRGYLILVTGWSPANVLDTKMVYLAQGPAAGTWADEKTADLYCALALALDGHDGEKVLLSTGDVDGLAYLMNEGTMEVGQASVISSTDSDPRFAGYYNELPEKAPDVIVYNYDCVRDLEEFHAWLESSFAITGSADVSYGSARLQVLTVGQ